MARITWKYVGGEEERAEKSPEPVRVRQAIMAAYIFHDSARITKMVDRPTKNRGPFQPSLKKKKLTKKNLNNNVFLNNQNDEWLSP